MFPFNCFTGSACKFYRECLQILFLCLHWHLIACLNFANLDVCGHSYFEKQKILHPEINIDISDFFIHLHCVWMFTLIEELLMHGVEYSSMEKIVNEYIRFEISGWKKLLEM